MMPRRELFDDDEITERSSRRSPADGFGEFIGRRRRNEAVERRALLLSACLGGACLILAVSNIVLALRLAGSLPAERAAVAPVSATAPATAGAPPAPAAADVARAGDDPSPSAAPRASADVAPGPAVAREASRSASEGGRSAEPSARRGAAAPTAPVRDLPPRAERPPAAPSGTAVADVGGSPRRTAIWMVEAYGRASAEQRVRAAASFYRPGDPGGEYWRSVLAEMRSL